MSEFEMLKYLVEIGDNVLVSGPGGCGKSYLIQSLSEHLKKPHAITATTGIAAFSISGITLHSWSGIRLGTASKEQLFYMIRKNKKLRARWREIKILIVDEISMLGMSVFEKLDYIAKHIRETNLPFGGIQLIFSGDFLQLIPVKDNFAFMSELWNDLNFVPMIVETPYRYNDKEFFDILMQVRQGIMNQEIADIFYARVDAYNKWKQENHSSTDIKPTILYSHKLSTDQYNMMELEKLPSPKYIYETKSTVVSKSATVMTGDLQNLIHNRFPRLIVLKVGAQVMLKANIDIQEGLVNGSRAVILETHKDYVVAKFVNGDVRRIMAITWNEENDDFLITQSQIPFILAWATTIHSSQSLTLDYVVCDLGESVFAEGQAYVALSRVRNLKGLFLSDFDPKSIFANKEAIRYDKILKENRAEFESVLE